jgi:lipopolysaccharide heptosyltransferase II
MVQPKKLDNPGKLMVRATNWIGDALMSLPAIEALRRSFPQAEIVLVAKPWVSEIYANHPAINRIIKYDSTGEHRGAAGLWRLIKALREESFDAAVLLQNAFHAAWMAWLARIPVRIGFARDGRAALLTDAVGTPPPAEYGHQVYYYLELLFRAGLIPAVEEVPEVRLAVTAEEKSWAATFQEQLGLSGPRFLIGMTPGAAFGPAKRWPPDRFAMLADRLIGHLNADVLILGSAGERPLAEQIGKAMRHTPAIVAGETTLRQLMALLSACRVLVTNDSGPMHLGAALGLPVVAVFGSTDERATGPVGHRARVVKDSAECSPCGLRVCPVDFRCMTDVSVDAVFETVAGLVEELGVTHEKPA